MWPYGASPAWSHSLLGHHSRLKYYDEIPDLKLSVVLDLKWLAKLMKLLFRHDHENTLQYRTEYFDKFGVDDYGFSNDAAKLKQCAVLSFDLLR